MPESMLHLSKPTLAYAKLVATPTETSWSQVYNAGNLFACVSLTVEEQPDDSVSLATAGKTILDNLQAEFFVLEEKSLPAIKEVIEKCIQEVPQYLSVAMTVGFYKDSVLYLFIVGQGRVIMKRHGNIGVLLQGQKAQTHVITASGYLQNEDMALFETQPFAEDINDETLVTALELSIPNDIAEALSPQLHAKEDGGQAAIIVVYHGASKNISMTQPADEAESQHESMQEEMAADEQEGAEEEDNEESLAEGETSDDRDDESEYVAETSLPRKGFSLPNMPSFGFLSQLSSKVHMPVGIKLSHRRKLFLSIIVILLIILGISIFFTKKNEADKQQKELFKQVYEPALNKYEGAKALETLNKDVSYEDYLAAKKLLTDNKSKFTPGSTEAKQIDALLAKVEAELTESSPVQSADAKEASVGAHSMLAVAKSAKDAKGITQDDTAVYYVTDKAIVSVSKGSGAKSDIVKNDNSWEDPIGLATYLGNLYVLDRKKGIIKFASGSYSQSAYFKDKPDLSAANALAIDSAVWILLNDGTILKYTSGVADGFKAPKLEKTMASPNKIFTDANTSNVYVLDRGNSRVIRIAKEGSGHTEYTSSVIKSASDFEVIEKDKKILIFSGDKIYEIAI